MEALADLDKNSSGLEEKINEAVALGMLNIEEFCF